MVDTGVGDDDEDDDNKESKTPIYTLHAINLKRQWRRSPSQVYWWCTVWFIDVKISTDS